MSINNMENASPYILYYIHQFGRARYKGANYLARILKHYIAADPPFDAADFKRLVAKAAAEKDVKPLTVALAIKRYVKDGWKQGFNWEWQKFTGWSADTPPDAKTAVKLLCESFPGFVKKYGALIQENKSYYLRDVIPKKTPSLSEIISSWVGDGISSFRYIGLEDRQELDTYVHYITYRVQRDLFEVCQKSPQLRMDSWQQFVLEVRHKKQVQDAAVIVAKEIMCEFLEHGSFDFGASPAKMFPDCGADESSQEPIKFLPLFSVNEGRALIECVLWKAEREQYQRQIARRKSYSWDSFLDELVQKGPLWRETLMAFQDALAALDFKPLWQSERLEKLVKQ